MSQTYPITSQMLNSYETSQSTPWQSLSIEQQDAWASAWSAGVCAAIAVAERHRVSIGNSMSGELAAEWTIDNIRELRESLRDLMRQPG